MDFPFIGKKNTEGAPAPGAEISATALREEASLYQRGLASMKDLIAPPAIKVVSNHMQIGAVLSRTHFVIAYPRFLSTNWFSPIINLDFPMDISLFVHPIDTSEILKQLRTSATRVESQIGIEQEKGKIRDPILETAIQDIEELRDRLLQGTEKFFRFGLYFTLYADTEENLNKMSQSVESMLEAQLVYVKPAVMRRVVCRFPGPINARPASTRSPSAASLTSTRQIESNRRAKALVKPSGMCWTITTPGAEGGRA
jgi:hypothetical protein